MRLSPVASALALLLILFPSQPAHAGLLDFDQGTLEKLAGDLGEILKETLSKAGGGGASGSASPGEGGGASGASGASGGGSAAGTTLTAARDGDGHGGAGVHYEAASGNAKFSVILLHGLSASVDQLTILASAGQTAGMRNTRFLLPQAPDKFVNYRNRVEASWFNIDGTDPGAKEHPAEILAAARRVERLIAGEEAAGVPKGNVAVVGMSQGGAVAATVYMRGPRLRAAVLLATWLPLAASYPAAQSKANAAVAARMIHGGADRVVEPAWAKASAEVMRRAGRKVEYEEIQGAQHAFGVAILRVAGDTITYLKKAGIN